MKAAWRFLLVSAVAFLAGAETARAQILDHPVYVDLSFDAWFETTTVGDFSVMITDEEGNNIGFNELDTASESFGPYTAKLYPNKKYTVYIVYANAASGTEVVFHRPRRGGLEMKDAAGNVLEGPLQYSGYGDDDLTVEIKRVEESVGATLRAGESTSLTPDKPIWYMSLGNTRYGTSAGEIGFRQEDFSDSDFFTQDILYYENPDDSEIDVPDRYNGVQQIYTREVLVEIKDLPSDKYEIRVYPRSEVGSWTGNEWPVTDDNWFVRYEVSKMTNSTHPSLVASGDVGVLITRQEKLPSAGTQTGQKWETSLIYDDDTEDTWYHRDWRDESASTSDVVETVYNSTETEADVYVSGTGVSGFETDALVWKKTFSSGDKELTSRLFGENETVPMESTYDYHSFTSSTSGALDGWLESVVRPDGSWTYYTYFVAGGSGEPVAGSVKRTFHPWKSDVSDPANATASNSVYEDWTYTTGPTGNIDVPASRIRRAPGGDILSKTQWTYDHDWTTKNSHTIALETRKDYWGTGTNDYLTTLTAYHSKTDSDPYFRGRPVSIARPNGSKDAYVYYRDGTWSDTNHSFDASTSGDDQLVLVFHGQSTAGSSPWAGNSTTAWSKNGESWSMDTVYLVPNRSTITETIIDIHGRVVLRAENVYLGQNNMARVSGTHYKYDSNGRLISEVDIIRSVGSNEVKMVRTYDGPLLETETSPEGVVTKHEYDDFLRQTKKSTGYGGASPYPAKIQTFKYDGAGRLAESTPCDCTSSPTKYTYDTAGRLTKEEAPSPNTSEVLETKYQYNTISKTTTTFPNGGTRIAENHLDGRPFKITGTVQTAMTYEYGLDSGDSLPYTKVHTKNSSDVTVSWTRQKSDLLGRPVLSTRQSWDWTTSSSKEIDTHYVYNSKGQLWHQQVKQGTNELAPAAVFEYNPAGQRIREGVDLNDNSTGTLDNADRITEYDAYFQDDTWGWYTVETVKVADDTSGGADKQISRVHTRLVGFNNNTQPGTGQFVVGDQVTIDANGRLFVQWNFIEPDARKSWSTMQPHGQDTVTARTSINGYLSEQTSLAGVKSRNEYDSKGRLQYQKTRYNGSSYDVVATTAYKGDTAFVESVTQNNGKVEYTYAWDPTTTKTRTVTAKTYRNTTLESTVTTLYNARDLPQQVWGDGATPTEFVYDDLGRRTFMKTWRDGAYTSGAWPNGLDNDTLATTEWVYQDPGGLLSKKLYNGDTSGDPGIAYEYDLLGRVTKRTWDRGASTTYQYYATGELSTVDRSDNGTGVDVTFTYSHLGQVATVAENGSTRTFNYNSTNPLRVDSEDLGSFYGSRRLGYLYETAGGAVGRPKGFQLGTSGDPDLELEQTVTFTSKALIDDIIIKRNNGASSRTFSYGYNTTTVSGLVETLTSGDFVLERDYESDRNALTWIDAKWDGSSVTRYDYTYNEIGQRVTARQSGTAFADYHDNDPGTSVPITRRFEYAPTGELTAAIDYLGTDTNPGTGRVLPGRYHRYSYDNLGNRESVNRDVADSAAIRDEYDFGSFGALNQYYQRENNRLAVSGTADYDTTVAVEPTGGGGTADRQGSYWHYDLAVANGSGPWSGTIDVKVSDANSYNTATRAGKLPQISQTFQYDADGNLTNDGIWAYTWDAENRLSTMDRTTAAVSAGYPDQFLEFAYDYLGRRVSKKVTEGGSTTETRFLYNGWNLIAELTVNGSQTTVHRSYTWGLDIASGSSTGGVGALVQLTDHGSGTDYLPTYDGNGNLAALVDAASGDVDAAYEYTPYGELLRAEGSYADDNPFRFSTKYTDTETGLAYFGYRYYDPANGRFINRDPIQEQGGINLYAFAGNDPVNRIDVLGLCGQWYNTECYEDVLELPGLPSMSAQARIAADDGAAESHYAMVDDWLWNIEKPKYVDWYNWNQRRKRVLRALTPEQREVANEYQRKLYEDRRRRPNVFLHDIEFIGYESDLREAEIQRRLQSAYARQRDIFARTHVAERAPAYVSTTGGLLSFAEIERENQRRSEQLNPQAAKGWGWQSINDIPTINETADVVVMLPINIMVGLVGGEAIIGAAVVKGAPYVIQGGKAAFNFSGDASAALLYGGMRGGQIVWRGSQLVAGQGYINAGALATRYGLGTGSAGFFVGFTTGPSGSVSFSSLPLIPYEIGEAAGGVARSVYDYVND